MTLAFFNSESQLVLLSLDLEHVIVFRSIAFFLLEELLLPLLPLLVQIHLESHLQLALLIQLFLFGTLLGFVLVAENGTPLIEDFFLSLDRQVSTLGHLRQRHVSSLHFCIP